jgi:L-amino acid N-acyltransferase YncA
MQISIRDAVEDDLAAIVEIFNQGISSRRSTGYLNEATVAQRMPWFRKHGTGTYPLLVALNKETVVGWVSCEPYREGRGAFHTTVEISLFVREKYTQKGVGSALLQAMMTAAKKIGYERIIAIVLAKNTGSIRLFEKHGFERWGLLPKVARIDEDVMDHVYYGREL